MNFELSAPVPGDEAELEEFYRTTISDTFRVNGIDAAGEIEGEVEHQMNTFHSATASRGERDFQLIARIEGQLAGTIAAGKQNRSVNENIPSRLKDLPEIKGVYVHPDYQSKGLGSRLWKTMISALHEKGVDKACLDSGYPLSQAYWKKKIGEPAIVMKDYWGPGADQMIWFFSVKDLYRNLP